MPEMTIADKRLPNCYRCGKSPCECADGITLYTSDCQEVLSMLAGDSIDAIVTDPPYHLTQASRNGSPRKNDLKTPFGRTKLGSAGFMGKTWDGGDIAFRPELWREALRVAKPGAHLLAFGGTRTFHRLAVAIEDAGWEIRDTIMWVYGQGFPKSLDVSKAIDKAAGAERKVVGEYNWPDGKSRNTESHTTKRNGRYGDIKTNGSPATDAAKQWAGWGTALKPAWEPIIVARKPIDGTVAANVLEHGCGGINVDGCRVGTEDVSSAAIRRPGTQRFNGQNHRPHHDGEAIPTVHGSTAGRWPANLVHDGSEEVIGLFPTVHGRGNVLSETTKPGKRGVSTNLLDGCKEQYVTSYPHCNDSGSAARFFYCAKASDRDIIPAEDFPLLGESHEAVKNTHPTVKPLALMEWLVKLVTPPDGIVLDSFAGSGTTLRAAKDLGRKAIGIEIEEKYCAIAAERLRQGVMF